MHDTLGYLSRDPLFRQYHQAEMTFSMMYAYSENFVLPLSHDEVVHGKGSLLGKMPGDAWRRFAGLRALLAYMWAHPGKQLLFMGSEFGQAAEWSEQAGLDWAALGDPRHAGVQQLVADLNQLYRGSPALWRRDTAPDGFSWIDANDAAGNVLSFLRFAGPDSEEAGPGPAGPGRAGPSATDPVAADPGTAEPAAAESGLAKPGTAEPGAATPGAAESSAAGTGGSGGARVLACVANFSGSTHYDYRIGLPAAGRWREVINTDAAVYGGSGAGNLGMIEATSEPRHGRPASASITLPPLAVLFLTPQD
jgi:1,4-alpha-glucan branching enzyme